MSLLSIYVLYSNVNYIYPVSYLVEIKLFQNCFKLLHSPVASDSHACHSATLPTWLLTAAHANRHTPTVASDSHTCHTAKLIPWLLTAEHATRLCQYLQTHSTSISYNTRICMPIQLKHQNIQCNSIVWMGWKDSISHVRVFVSLQIVAEYMIFRSWIWIYSLSGDTGTWEPESVDSGQVVHAGQECLNHTTHFIYWKVQLNIIINWYCSKISITINRYVQNYKKCIYNNVTKFVSMQSLYSYQRSKANSNWSLDDTVLIDTIIQRPTGSHREYYIHSNGL